MRVLCAMSGGVDSSVAAALLREAGHEVIGITMQLYDASGTPRGRGGTCCSPAEIDRARTVCAKLGIAHYTVDERDRFERQVVENFVDEYLRGRTPNPCVRCNEFVKFAPLLARADALGAKVLATGHYAQNLQGELHRAADETKDQTYFLFAMGKAALARVQFPLGTRSKADVREKARALGLPTWAAPDSQELCFVPGGDHGEVIEARLAARGRSREGLAPGPVVDAEGQVLGEHRGIHRVTIGQRRGLRTQGTERRYALAVVPETRTVVVGAPEALAVHSIRVGDLRRLRLEGEHGTIEAGVQVRHRGAPVRARIAYSGSEALVSFVEPMSGVAPGQAAVFYDGSCVVAGGWIDAVTRTADV